MNIVTLTGKSDKYKTYKGVGIRRLWVDEFNQAAGFVSSANINSSNLLITFSLYDQSLDLKAIYTLANTELHLDGHLYRFNDISIDWVDMDQAELIVTYLVTAVAGL
jgi:hypothetical protein